MFLIFGRNWGNNINNNINNNNKNNLYCNFASPIFSDPKNHISFFPKLGVSVGGQGQELWAP